MTESYKLAEEFRRMRTVPEHHLGLGDIRITMGQQEDILATLQRLEHQLWMAEGALQEIHSVLGQATETQKRVEGALESMKK